MSLCYCSRPAAWRLPSVLQSCRVSVCSSPCHRSVPLPASALSVAKVLILTWRARITQSLGVRLQTRAALHSLQWVAAASPACDRSVPCFLSPQSSLHGGWQHAHGADAKREEPGATRTGTPLCPPGRSGVLRPQPCDASRSPCPRSPGCADSLMPGLLAPAVSPSLPTPRAVQTLSCGACSHPHARRLSPLPGAGPAWHGCFSSSPGPRALRLGRPPTPSSCGILPELSF